MTDTGAEAAVTNPLHLLHKPMFCSNDKPCPVKMCGAITKDTSITPVAKGFLQIPTITLPGWTEVERHSSPRFAALNEQDPLKATGWKSDCLGPTVNKLFDKEPDHLQHASRMAKQNSKK